MLDRSVRTTVAVAVVVDVVAASCWWRCPDHHHAPPAPATSTATAPMAVHLVMAEVLQRGRSDLGVEQRAARGERALHRRIGLAEPAVVGQLVGRYSEAVAGGELRRAGRVAVVRQAVRAQASCRPNARLHERRRRGGLVIGLQTGRGEKGAAGLADRILHGVLLRPRLVAADVLDAARIRVDVAVRSEYRVLVGRHAVCADALRGRVQLRRPGCAVSDAWARYRAAAVAEAGGAVAGSASAAAPGPRQARHT